MAAGNPTGSVERRSMPLPKVPGPRRQFRYVVPDPDLAIRFANLAGKSISGHGYLSGGPLSA